MKSPTEIRTAIDKCQLSITNAIEALYKKCELDVEGVDGIGTNFIKLKTNASPSYMRDLKCSRCSFDEWNAELQMILAVKNYPENMLSLTDNDKYYYSDGKTPFEAFVLTISNE